MHDRTLYWPSAVAVVGPVALLVICAGPFDLIWILLAIGALALWAIAGAAAAVMCAVWVYQRAWRRVVSALVLPLLVLSAGVDYKAVWRSGRVAGDYTHLLIMYPFYLAEVAELPEAKASFAVWSWGGFAIHQNRGVAYDESDEIASDRPSGAWKKRAESSGLIGYGYTPAIGHFYFVALR